MYNIEAFKMPTLKFRRIKLVLTWAILDTFFYPTTTKSFAPLLEYDIDIKLQVVTVYSIQYKINSSYKYEYKMQNSKLMFAVCCIAEVISYLNSM